MGITCNTRTKIADNPGGSHSFGASNIPTRGKDAGARLAWGEGQATYIGVAAQFVNTAANNTPLTTPNVGDTHYQDTEDSTLNIDLAVASRTAAAGEATNWQYAEFSGRLPLRVASTAGT